MSIVRTSNTKRYVEINSLEYLKHSSNWNGGTWSNLDVVKHPEKYDFFVLNTKDIFEVVVKKATINGYDSDMGNKIYWEIPSLEVLIESNILDVYVPIEKILSNDSNVVMYLVKDV